MNALNISYKLRRENDTTQKSIGTDLVPYPFVLVPNEAYPIQHLNPRWPYMAELTLIVHLVKYSLFEEVRGRGETENGRKIEKKRRTMEQ
mmetsp:Transcript_42044/g.127509  ORF Transcript_42044/g.127509 Transcript_42044/m.127509 type:complete len:90 (-) Transcript_42044:45-314(-)